MDALTQEFLKKQREWLEQQGLSPEQIERAMEPALSFLEYRG